MNAAPLDHEALRKALEAAGLRCTPQRLAVYDRLTAARHHPTAEEIFQTVRAQIPKISLATIYKASKLWSPSARSPASRSPKEPVRLATTPAAKTIIISAACARAWYTICPTRFDPELISRLDPGLTQDLKEQGFQVTGYRLELVGYRDDGPAAEVPAAIHTTGEPSPTTRECPAGADGTKT